MNKNYLFLILIFLTNNVFSEENLPIVAVSQFEQTFQNDSRRRPASNPDNYEAMLETQLIKVGRFRVYERNKLEEVLREQGLQESLSGNNTQIKIDGVDYLIYGAITDMSSEAKEISTGGFASVRVSNRFGVDIKIVDALSGEIRRAESIVAVIDSGSGVATRNFSNIQADTNGLVEAQRIVAKRSAALLAESIFPIRVVDIFNDEIYLNYGDSILSIGDRLKVIQEGREIIDQDTGLSLGSRQKVLGEIEIVSADSNLSIAKIIKNDADFTVGAVAKIILETLGSKNNKQRERKGKKI
jgi:curli biogenesis system outer membrane secretion channel CsgG